MSDTPSFATKHLGDEAEALAVDYLEREGYVIIDRNFDAKVGDFVFSKWRYEFESIVGGTRVTEHTLDLRPEKVKAMGPKMSGIEDRDARNRETMEATLAALALAAER